MIQEIIWSNILAAGMALLTLGTIIVVVCVGVGFMIQVRHRSKKSERTGRHTPGSSRVQARISPDSELGRKLVNLDFRLSLGKGYQPPVEAQRLAAAPLAEPVKKPQEQIPAERRTLRRSAATPEIISAASVPLAVPPMAPSSKHDPADVSIIAAEPESLEPMPLQEAGSVVIDSSRLASLAMSNMQKMPKIETPSVASAPLPAESADPAHVELSHEEREAVLKIQEMLGMPTARVVLSVPQIEAILACGRALKEELRPIPVKGVILDPGEKAYFEFAADLLEIPPGGGVRLHFPPEFYLDVFRGILTPSPSAQKIDSGRLVVSSRRVLFVGSNRTLAMNYDLITGMDLFIDLLRINSVGKDRVCVIGLENPPLVALAISYAYREATA